MPNFISENGKNCRNLEEKNNHSGDKKNTKEYKRKSESLEAKKVWVKALFYI